MMKVDGSFRAGCGHNDRWKERSEESGAEEADYECDSGNEGESVPEGTHGKVAGHDARRGIGHIFEL